MSSLRIQQRTFITLIVLLLILSTVSFLNVNRNAIGYTRSTPSQQNKLKLATSVELQVPSTTAVTDKTTLGDNIATTTATTSSDSSSSPTATTSSIVQNESTGESTSHKQFYKYSYYDPTSNSFKVIYKQQPQHHQQKKEHKLQPTNKYTTINENPSVLILSAIGKDQPYGKDRLFSDFMKTIHTIIENQPDLQFNLGLSSNYLTEFENIQKFIDENDAQYFKYFNTITIVSAPDLEQTASGDDEELSRDNRHDDRKQRMRRRLIARCRNYLVSNALTLEAYTLFIDSDIVEFEHASKFIQFLIGSKKDIIVPRIRRGDLSDYDRNSWRGKRTKPTLEQLQLMDENKWDQFDYVPRDIELEMFHFFNLDNKDELTIDQQKLSYMVELDSVGGAVLFFKSYIFKQGAIFPTSYIIGTTWDRLEGYDGIETEGICYLAKPLGYRCWGMPNLVAHHVQ